MKSKILLLAVSVAALSSCTTAYKTGQTPDDVYYSPLRPEEEYVQRSSDDDRRYSGDQSYYEDQYLRMKVRNRYRWADMDDPYYYSNRYNYTSYYNGYFNNPWTPNAYWNTYYNPYCHGYVIFNPKGSIATTYSPRIFNLNTYNNVALTNNSYISPKYKPGTGVSGYSPGYYNSGGNSNSTRTRGASSNTGNTLRQIFRGESRSNERSNSGNSSNNSSSSNNNSSSSGSSSSSSSSSGSSAPVRRF